MAPTPVTDPWDRGDAYERYIGRWSRQVAPRFFSWLGLPAGLRWLDAGCGTGALSAAILDTQSPLSVTGLEPSPGFLATARANLTGRAGLVRAVAAHLPLARSSVDAAVSGLVLNFLPDPRLALIEMARTVRPGGTVAAYVWDYAGKMEPLRIFWDVAVELDPQAARLDEGIRFPLCNPRALAGLFEEAGLEQVVTTAIDIPAAFTGFEDYWQPFLGGQGPAPAYVLSLAPRDRSRLQERLRSRLPFRPDGSLHLLARAWAIRAIVP